MIDDSTLKFKKRFGSYVCNGALLLGSIHLFFFFVNFFLVFDKIVQQGIKLVFIIQITF